MKTRIFILVCMFLFVGACNRSVPNSPYTIKGNKVFYVQGTTSLLSHYKKLDLKASKTRFFGSPYRTYATDGKKLYCLDDEIKDANIAEFEELPEGYARDDKFVYWLHRRLEQANPEEFEVKLFPDPYNPEIELSFGMDKEHVFKYDTRLGNVAPYGFRPLGHEYYFTNGGIFFAYYEPDAFKHTGFPKQKSSRLVEVCDNISASVPMRGRNHGGEWLVDNECVFYQGARLHGVDAESFQVVFGSYGVDRYNAFYKATVLTGQDLEAFRKKYQSRGYNPESYSKLDLDEYDEARGDDD